LEAGGVLVVLGDGLDAMDVGSELGRGGRRHDRPPRRPDLSISSRSAWRSTYAPGSSMSSDPPRRRMLPSGPVPAYTSAHIVAEEQRMAPIPTAEYARLEERIVARDQKGASDVLYRLLGQDRPATEILRETIRIHAPYTHVPYHQRLDDGIVKF